MTLKVSGTVVIDKFYDDPLLDFYVTLKNLSGADISGYIDWFAKGN